MEEGSGNSVNKEARNQKQVNKILPEKKEKLKKIEAKIHNHNLYDNILRAVQKGDLLRILWYRRAYFSNITDYILIHPEFTSVYTSIANYIINYPLK